MKRKLIKQGIGGFTVYLPKKWIDTHNLGSEDSVDIEQIADSLIVRAKNKQHKKEYTLNMKEENSSEIRHILSHLYRHGADVITIKGVDGKLEKKIQLLTNKILLGFEVTQSSNGICILESISEPSEEKYDSILRRVFLLVKEAHALVVEDFDAQTFTHEQQMHDFVDLHDKLVIFCRRMLTKMRHDTHPMIMWELLTFLMHFMHGYHYLYKTMIHANIKHRNEIRYLLSELGSYYGLFYDAFYKRDLDRIHKIGSLKKKYQYGLCYDALKNATLDEGPIVSHIRELFRLMQIGTSPIYGIIFGDHWLPKYH